MAANVSNNVHVWTLRSRVITMTTTTSSLLTYAQVVATSMPNMSREIGASSNSPLTPVSLTTSPGATAAGSISTGGDIPVVQEAPASRQSRSSSPISGIVRDTDSTPVLGRSRRHDEAPVKDERLSVSTPAGIDEQMEREDVYFVKVEHDALPNVSLGGAYRRWSLPGMAQEVINVVCNIDGANFIIPHRRRMASHSPPRTPATLVNKPFFFPHDFDCASSDEEEMNHDLVATPSHDTRIREEEVTPHLSFDVPDNSEERFMQVFYDHMSLDEVQGFIDRVTHKYETQNTPGFNSSVERTHSHMASLMRSGSIDCHAAGLDGELESGGHADTSNDRIPYVKKGKWAVHIEDIEDDDDVEWRKAQMAADEQLAKEIEAAEQEAARKHKEAEDRLARYIEDAWRARSKASSTGRSLNIRADIVARAANRERSRVVQQVPVQSSRASNQLPRDSFVYKTLLGSKALDMKSRTRTSQTPSDSRTPVGSGYDSEATISEPSSVYSSDSDSTKRHKREKKKRYKKQRAHGKRELGNEKVVLPEKYDGSPKFDVDTLGECSHV
ncbi:hypothetical protein EDD85DRAFT_983366 [Armillaria nabsnona]|nr:hypothetical protein EDD85DRAFT_983366 [Armillaria nabsnona]